MNDINSKHISYGHCEDCGTEFPKNSIKKLKINRESIFCEYCGAETNYSQIQEINIQNKVTEISEVKYNSPFHRDPELSENFKYWMIKFICRMFYLKLSHQDSISKIEAVHKNVIEQFIDSITKEIRSSIIKKKRILIKEWLGELNHISKYDFIEEYKKLQAQLSSDQTYSEGFLEYIRQLAWIIFELVSENSYDPEHTYFYKVITNDLKNLNINFRSDNNFNQIPKNTQISKVKKKKSILKSENSVKTLFRT